MDDLCEICGKPIRDGMIVQVVSQTLIAEADGSKTVVDGNRQVVFARFHYDCVKATASSRDCDLVEYIDEARELVAALISRE